MSNDKTPEEIEREERERRRAERDAEIFGDLFDAESPEDIKAERDALRQTVAAFGERFDKLQEENLKLMQQIAAQKLEAAQVLARTETRFEEQKSFALEKFVKDVLPVVDNLEIGLRAINAEQRAADAKVNRIAQSVEKTLGQLSTVFNKFGVQEINPQGQSFDPEYHEAISTDDSVDADSETVVKVAQKGYSLHGRVLRPARVVVKP